MRTIYAVVMAGGVGSRFWPLSRERRPKQLLRIGGSGTMIQNTVSRISPLVPPERVFVVTNEKQKDTLKEQLQALPEDHILVEPVGRNTAPCIGLAALWIQQLDPEALMVVLPADHLIQDVDAFLATLRSAIEVAGETNGLLTVGIRPTRPETGYGYIQIDEEQSPDKYREEGIYRVKTFAEKPNLETADKFLRSGDFVWNSGMFIWSVGTVLDEIELHIPDLSEQLKKVGQSIGSLVYKKHLETAYGLIRSISIDYGLMEKARNVYVVRGDFGWSDVGSWDEAAKLVPSDEDGNAANGDLIALNTKNSFVETGGKMVALLGVEDLIVINTEDAILVCRRGQTQNVKDVVDYLRRKQMNDLL
jgi:mannose-1-phosphate guanylyltransferase